MSARSKSTNHPVRKRRWRLVCACLLAGAACTGQAAETISNLDLQLLVGNCVTCHGPNGQALAGSSIPTLRGQSSTALLERMQAFRAGAVSEATVMPLMMQGYDDAQMRALANWFARQEPAMKERP